MRVLVFNQIIAVIEQIKANITEDKPLSEVILHYTAPNDVRSTIVCSIKSPRLTVIDSDSLDILLEVNNIKTTTISKIANQMRNRLEESNIVYKDIIIQNQEWVWL
jgi:hypothetical protein